MKPEKLLFRDITSAIKIIASTYSDAICQEGTDVRGIYAKEEVALLAKLVGDKLPKEVIEEIFRSVMSAACHSLFTALDGGSKMAESVNLHVVDSDGQELPRDLHYQFTEYLFEIGMKK